MHPQDINLVPAEYTERVEHKRDTSIAAAIAIGCCLAVGMASHMLMRSVSLKRREAAVLRERIDTLRSQRMELVALAQEKKRILEELSALAGRFQGGRWVRPISALALAPEGVLLRTLQATDTQSPLPNQQRSPSTRQRIAITGWAAAEYDLQQFADLLRRSGSFSAVRTESTRQTRFEDIDAVEFQLECFVQSPLQEAAP